MKKILAFSIALILLMSSFVVSFAHRGKTDSEGGHYDRDSGEYHYHHGYPAHQHIDGVCEYDFNNNEDYNYHENNAYTYDYEYEDSTELHGYARIEKDKPTNTTEYVENTKAANAYNYTFEIETTTKKSLSDKIDDFESKIQDVVVILFLILLSVLIAFSIFCKLKEQFHKK